jgi:hypothetical protein
MVREAQMDQIKIANLVLFKVDISKMDHQIKIVCYTELHGSAVVTPTDPARCTRVRLCDVMGTEFFKWQINQP